MPGPTRPAPRTHRPPTTRWATAGRDRGARRDDGSPVSGRGQRRPVDSRQPLLVLPDDAGPVRGDPPVVAVPVVAPGPDAVAQPVLHLAVVGLEHLRPDLEGALAAVGEAPDDLGDPGG